MNVKFIFVFTICVVLPNGLYSNEKEKYKEHLDEKEKYCQTLLRQWTPGYQQKQNDTFEEDDKGNILIRILVQPGANKTDLFMVPNMLRLGVNITTETPDELKANIEVSDYFEELFRAPFLGVEVDEGLVSAYKTITLKHGHLHMVEVLKIIVDKYVELKYGSTVSED